MAGVAQCWLSAGLLINYIRVFAVEKSIYFVQIVVSIGFQSADPIEWTKISKEVFNKCLKFKLWTRDEWINNERPKSSDETIHKIEANVNGICGCGRDLRFASQTNKSLISLKLFAIWNSISSLNYRLLYDNDCNLKIKWIKVSNK